MIDGRRLCDVNNGIFSLSATAETLRGNASDGTVAILDSLKFDDCQSETDWGAK